MFSHDSRNLSLKTHKLPQQARSLAVVIACVIIAGLLYFYDLAQKQAQQELFAQQVAQRQNEASETYKIGDTVQLTGLDQEGGNPAETPFGAYLPWIGTIEVTVTNVTLYHSIDEAGFTSEALNHSSAPENADSLYLVYTLHFKNIDAVQKHTPNGPNYILITSYSINAEGHNIFMSQITPENAQIDNSDTDKTKGYFWINAGDECDVKLAFALSPEELRDVTSIHLANMGGIYSNAKLVDIQSALKSDK
ncbi:MAG: hypothetical protein M3I19_02270 [Lancefieldella parvula]|uniref:Uncharacterized protein n=1 Tax=Lancefieldella parvula TaxID=1382 RepID=A0A9E7D5P4_9ACTN|nr:hypothetical protein [Atopobium sp.]UQF78538.1 MAG: hypothetical protein M3I19_02270 [Lancefieldella parvula]